LGDFERRLAIRVDDGVVELTLFQEELQLLGPCGMPGEAGAELPFRQTSVSRFEAGAGTDDRDFGAWDRVSVGGDVLGRFDDAGDDGNARPCRPEVLPDGGEVAITQRFVMRVVSVMRAII
jgi:hypothetical protein